MIKLFTTCFFLVLFFNVIFAENQFYKSVCTDNQLIMVNDKSRINWGSVESDLITLKKLRANENGYIEFNIDNVVHVEIVYQEETNANLKFGFVFKDNSAAVIINEGIEMIDLPAISYSYQDKFKVEKCDGQLCYYKNDEILFCVCINDSITDLVNTTKILDADNARINLEFETNTSCTITLPLLGNGIDELNSKVETSFDPHELVIIDIYDQENKAINQFRSRVDSRGFVQNQKQLDEYLKKGYRINFKKARKN